MKPPRYLLAVGALMSCAAAFAQDSLSQQQRSEPLASTTQRVLKAGTPVRLRLLETIGSETHERGAMFPLEVSEAISIDGVTLIPAGARAEGEVVHVAKSAMLGKAGELTLTSRAAFVDGRSIRLAGLLLADSAESRQRGANAAQQTANVLSDLEIVRGMGAGAYGTALAVFIQGKRVVVPEGTELVGRIASDESFGGSRLVAATPQAAAEHGTIVFYRLAKPRTPGYGFKVREGTVEVGTLRRGEYFIVTAAPGVHEYTVHSEAKDVLTVEAEAGETLYVQGSFTKGLVAPRPNLAPSTKEAFEAAREGLMEAAQLHDE